MLAVSFVRASVLYNSQQKGTLRVRAKNRRVNTNPKIIICLQGGWLNECKLIIQVDSPYRLAICVLSVKNVVKMAHLTVPTYLINHPQGIYYILQSYIFGLDCGCKDCQLFKCPRSSERRRFLAGTATPESWLDKLRLYTYKNRNFTAAGPVVYAAHATHHIEVRSLGSVHYRGFKN